MRRGGLLENRQGTVNNGFCEFRPTPNMVAAYGEGKKIKHKISIMSKKSRGSAESHMSNIDPLRITRKSG